MKLKSKKTIALIVLLLALILTIGLVGGCTRGSVAIGWSGGTVSGNTLFIGSDTGRLSAINLTDSSILHAEALTAQSSGSFLSCASLGCGTSSVSVPIYGTPVVSDDLVYVAGYNGQIAAYRTDNLAERWVYPRQGFLKSFVGSPVIYDNKLFIGCTDGVFYAFDADTGDLLYQFKTGDRIWGSPAVDPSTNTILFGSYDKKFYALSTNDLSLKWSYTTKGSIISTPLVDNGIVYFGSFDRYLYAVKISDGSLVWQFQGTNWFWAQPQLLNGVLYAGCLDNFVYAIDPATGKSVHDPYDLNSAVASSPAIVDNFIIFASRNGIIYKIDSKTGDMTLVIDLKTSVDGPLMANGGIVYIHPQTDTLLRVNPVSGATLPAISL